MYVAHILLYVLHYILYSFISKEQNFQAIYCYTPDGRGPCYAVEGQKIMLEWFRTYLVIVAKEAANVPRTTTTISAKPK